MVLISIQSKRVHQGEKKHKRQWERRGKKQQSKKRGWDLLLRCEGKETETWVREGLKEKRLDRKFSTQADRLRLLRILAVGCLAVPTDIQLCLKHCDPSRGRLVLGITRDIELEAEGKKMTVSKAVRSAWRNRSSKCILWKDAHCPGRTNSWWDSGWEISHSHSEAFYDQEFLPFPYKNKIKKVLIMSSFGFTTCTGTCVTLSRSTGHGSPPLVGCKRTEGHEQIMYLSASGVSEDCRNVKVSCMRSKNQMLRVEAD